MSKKHKEEMNCKKLIGKPQLRFDELSHKGWDWSSFYNGWLEGRFDLYVVECKHRKRWNELKTIIKNENKAVSRKGLKRTLFLMDDLEKRI